MTDNKAVMQPVAWMTKDGRVASDATKQNSMASPSKEAFNIPLYLSCVIAQPEHPAIEKNFCARCGKRLAGDGIHTCTPPKAKT